MHMLIFTRINLNAKFGMLSFTHFRDTIEAQDLKLGHVTLTTPILGQSVIPRLILDMGYQCTRFEDSTFSLSTDMKEDPNTKIGVIWRD